MNKLFEKLSTPLLKRILLFTGFDPKSREEVDMNDFKEVDDLSWKETVSVDRKMFICFCAVGNRIICNENTMLVFLL